MSTPSFNLNRQGLGRLATFVSETAAGNSIQGNKRDGNLAGTLRPRGNGVQEINVVQDYPWTLSVKKDWTQWEEVPYIRLKEYKCVDSSIKKQLGFYFQLSKDTAAAVGAFAGRLVGQELGLTDQDSIQVYSDIWPKDHPSNFQYIFPYFQKTGLELNTEQWTTLGSMGDDLKNVAEGTVKTLNLGKAGQKFIEGASKVFDVLQAGAQTFMQYGYPNVSITDRPRIFSSHNERTITVNFTLYNTLGPNDWQANRNLVYLLMSQNLFNKRDLTTGVPPVFYDVYIPGQYFSYASCVTQFKVEYLGNQRLLYGDYIVPDAYDVTMTLTEMVKPSKNQFEAVQSGAARNHVNVNYTKTQNPQETSALNQISQGVRDIAAKILQK